LPEDGALVPKHVAVGTQYEVLYGVFFILISACCCLKYEINNNRHFFIYD
jgi:hypothetical protein